MSRGNLPANKSSQSRFDQAIQLFRDPKERSWILVTPSSLGETWIICALAKAFRLQHPGPLTIVLKETSVPIAQMYSDDISRIVPVQGLADICKVIHPYSMFAMDIPYIVDQFYFGDGRMMHLTELLSQPNRGGLRGLDMFRYMMHLDWDSPLTPGTIPADWRQEAEAVAHELGLVRGKSVVLFPDNNTNWPVADELWQKLADDLRAQGLTVLTNLHGNDVRNYHGLHRQAFAETLGYAIPLRLAAPLVEFAGGFVTGANGIANVIAGTARCRSAILLHETLPGQRSWSGEDINKAWTQSSWLHSFDYSGLIPHDLREYLIKQGEDNTEALQQIVEQMAR